MDLKTVDAGLLQLSRYRLTKQRAAVMRAQLSARETAACFFGLAPELEEKIIANNRDYVAAGGRFYSMFADSARSIRTLLAA